MLALDRFYEKFEILGLFSAITARDTIIGTIENTHKFNS